MATGAEGTTLKMVEVFKVLEIHKWRKEKNCYRNNVRKLGEGNRVAAPTSKCLPSQGHYLKSIRLLNLMNCCKPKCLIWGVPKLYSQTWLTLNYSFQWII